MTCLGLHYTIFDTGGEDAKHFTLTQNHRFGSNRGGDLLCQGMEWMLFSNQKLLYETQDIRDRHCAVTVDIKLENS